MASILNALRRALGVSEPSVTVPEPPSDGTTKPPETIDLHPLSRWLEVVTTIAGTVTLTGAILFYFGWARTAAAFGYFGIDLSVLDLSFRDYLLRSVNSAFGVLGTAVGLTLVALLAHRYVLEELQQNPRLVKVLGQVLLGAGALAVLVGVLAAIGLAARLAAWPVAPPALLIGLALGIYGSHLTGRARAEIDPTPRTPPAPSMYGLLAVVAVLLIFWTTSSYASYGGNLAARRLAADVDSRPHVVIYSKTDLGLSGPGTSPRSLPRASGRYRFRYDGLRLLIKSGERFFLLPAGWTRARGSVLVIRDSPDIRVEFSVEG
ncbi:hypothetical protein [Cryptosporangium minutisporangium]|uniref:Uncharacterized protein n=1 Tax=Cryptosporangium minutisporangium TaxID=113569 RepID=A0ABP6SSQ3_9ACTN